MIVDGVDVLYYVKIGPSIFAIANNGQWHAITPDKIHDELPLHEFDIDSILINPDSNPYIVINQQSVLIPQSLVISSSQDNPSSPPSNNNSAENNLSSSGETNSDTNNNAGLNYFYQIIQTRYNALIAESGYTTQADNLTNQSNTITSLIGEQDSFLTLTLSVNIEDAKDGYLNQFEVPTVDINGQALDARDGQQLTLTLTDINGKQITLLVTVSNESWQLNDLDISDLAEGLITAEISAPTYQGEANPATDQSIKDTLASISIEIEDQDNVINAAEINSVNISGAVANVEDGQTVVITISDANGHSRNITTTVVNGAWFIGSLDLSDFEQGSLTATAEVIDIAGNPISATTGEPIDILAAVNITVDTGNDEFVNRFEMKKLDFSGSVFDVEDGQAVTITITDVDGQTLTYTTQVVDGSWRIEDADIEALVDGELRFDVNTQDIAGNPASSSTTVIKDTVANVTINVLDSDQILNQQDIDDLNTIFGVANNIEDGQVIFITVTDSLGQVFTLSSEVSNGLWTVSGLDASDLADGILHLYAVAIDAEGNPAFATNTILKDTKADIDIEIVDADGVLNGSEMAKVLIRGSVTNVEDGQTVTVSLTDNQGHSMTLTAIVTGGIWTLSAQDLSAFDDGTLEVTAEVSDIAGNPASAITQMPVDILADITIDVDTGSDTVINRFEMLRLNFSGQINDVEDGQTITITLTDSLNNQLTFNTTVVAGTWQIDDADVSSLVDGDINFTANTVDIAGNPASATTTVSKDSQATISITLNDSDSTLNSFEETNATITGFVTNVEEGQTVSVWAIDQNGVRIPLTAIVSNGAFSISGVDLSSLAEGTIYLKALVVDLSGNPAFAGNSFTKDTAADITVEIVDNDGVINATEMTQVVIQGSVTNVEDGQTVTVNLTDNQGHSLTVTAIVTGGVWILPAQDLSNFDDGSLVVTAEVSDIAGLPAIS
ncbi:Ig-like domain-containing protein, partial [Shewanella sp. TC10]|uniref:Ig-like domain-containing protein n=1 Tax=Shewanella sp. TC10 TaxID=1419739 RepID=UPI001E307821